MTARRKCYKSIIVLLYRALGALLLAGLATAANAGAQDLQLAFSPRLPDDADGLRLTLVHRDGACDGLELQGPAVVHADHRITVPLEWFTIHVLCPVSGDRLSTLDLPRLAAGTYSVELVVDDAVVLSRPLTVRRAATILPLHDGRFQVSVAWRNPYGPGAGAGYATRLSEESGSFWFFDGANQEVTVKVLDGSGVNGHAWVFVASMTTVETLVTVIDVGDGLCLMLPVVPPACPTRTYAQPAFENRNFVDVEAFPWAAPTAAVPR